MVNVELIALIASRICHDLVSPVGAIANGIEILGEEAGDQAIRDQALDLIAGSALQASRRLSFCRLALGAGGGPAAMLDTIDVVRAATELLEGGRVSLDWRDGPPSLPRNVVKVTLLFIMAGADCLARGGRLSVTAAHSGDKWQIRVSAHGDRLTVHPALSAAIAGTLEMSEIDAKLAPTVYAGHLARERGGIAALVNAGGALRLEAELP
jgi:histidine phosphotransferase ChpT